MHYRRRSPAIWRHHLSRSCAPFSSSRHTIETTSFAMSRSAMASFPISRRCLPLERGSLPRSPPTCRRLLRVPWARVNACGRRYAPRNARRPADDRAQDSGAAIAGRGTCCACSHRLNDRGRRLTVKAATNSSPPRGNSRSKMLTNLIRYPILDYISQLLTRLSSLLISKRGCK
jgi:hypothetical protein